MSAQAAGSLYCSDGNSVFYRPTEQYRRNVCRERERENLLFVSERKIFGTRLEVLLFVSCSY